MDLYFRVKLLKRNVAIALCEFSLFLLGYVNLRLKMVIFWKAFVYFFFCGLRFIYE